MAMVRLRIITAEANCRTLRYISLQLRCTNNLSCVSSQGQSRVDCMLTGQQLPPCCCLPTYRRAINCNIRQRSTTRIIMHALKLQSQCPLLARQQRVARQVLCCAASRIANKEDYQRQAACYTIENYVQSGQTVAMGSGALVSYAIEHLGRLLTDKALENVTVISCCPASASEAAFHGVRQSTLEAGQQVDLYIEQVDEVDCATGELPYIVGRTSDPAPPQLALMRTVAAAAKQRVVLLDDLGRVKERLGGELPVVIQHEGWEDTAEEIDDIMLGDAELWLRPTEPSSVVGPRADDRPYISQEDTCIVDIRFYGDMKLFGDARAPYASIAAEIEGIEGVVTHGMFLVQPTAAIIAMPQGEPLVLEQGERITSSMTVGEDLSNR